MASTASCILSKVMAHSLPISICSSSNRLSLGVTSLLHACLPRSDLSDELLIQVPGCGSSLLQQVLPQLLVPDQLASCRVLVKQHLSHPPFDHCFLDRLAQENKILELQLVVPEQTQCYVRDQWRLGVRHGITRALGLTLQSMPIDQVGAHVVNDLPKQLCHILLLLPQGHATEALNLHLEVHDVALCLASGYYPGLGHPYNGICLNLPGDASPPLALLSINRSDINS